MRLIAKTILFIMNKWDTSMDEFKPIGKFFLYIPMILNNILTQIFYFVLFPLTLLYIWGKEKIEPFLILYNSLKFYFKF